MPVFLHLGVRLSEILLYEIFVDLCAGLMVKKGGSVSANLAKFIAIYLFQLFLVEVLTIIRCRYDDDFLAIGAFKSHAQ